MRQPVAVAAPVVHTHIADPEEVRRGNLGFVLAILGVATTAFAVGRMSAHDGDCRERLVHRDLELILCEARQANDPFPALIG